MRSEISTKGALFDSLLLNTNLYGRAAFVSLNGQSRHTPRLQVPQLFRDGGHVPAQPEVQARVLRHRETAQPLQPLEGQVPRRGPHSRSRRNREDSTEVPGQHRLRSHGHRGFRGSGWERCCREGGRGPDGLRYQEVRSREEQGRPAPPIRCHIQRGQPRLQGLRPERLP